MPVEQLVRSICDYKQAYTQYGGLRPFGVSFLFAGYDRYLSFFSSSLLSSLRLYPTRRDASTFPSPLHSLPPPSHGPSPSRHQGFQLYESDPAGTFGGWSATAIGANFQAGKSLLKNEYPEGGRPSVQEGLTLAAKVLLKTMDTTIPSAEKVGGRMGGREGVTPCHRDSDGAFAFITSFPLPFFLPFFFPPLLLFEKSGRVLHPDGRGEGGTRRTHHPGCRQDHFFARGSERKHIAGGGYVGRA